MSSREEALNGEQRSPDLLVVTDLDGTLLDHRTYSFEPAEPALERLRSRHVPVVLCSSKTRAEIVQLVEALDNRAPFIVENGSAICANPHKNGDDGPVKEDVALGRDYSEIVRALHMLRTAQGFAFRGFTDMTDTQVAELTGLPVAQARLARQREYSEPLLWADSGENRSRFLLALDEYGLTAQQGGRFLTVSGRAHKGRAVKVLKALYGADREPMVVALGDSFNDLPMLEAADIAVVVKSAHSKNLVVENPGRVIYTTEPGPKGWNSAILEILEEYNNG